MSRRPLSSQRPTAPEAAALIRELYRAPTGGAGCCLHVIIDDGNTGDGFLDAAELERIRDVGHPLCVRLAEMLAAMSTTQRRKAIAMAATDGGAT